MTIEVTRKCNANCPHCILPERKDDGLPVDRLYNFLNRNLHFFEKGVTLTGGEPYLTDKTHSLINYVQRRGKRIAVITNGSIGRKTFYGSRPNSIKISLDYPGDKHNEVRGIRNLFQTICESTIPAAKSHGVPVELMCTINHMNMGYMDEMVNLSRQLDVSLSFNRYIHNSKTDGLALSQEECHKMLDNIKRYRQEGRRVGYSGGLGCHIEGRASFCTAGINKVHLTAHGQLTPCMFYLKKFGTVNQSLIKIRNAMLNWRVDYERKVKYACGSCHHYDKVCGGDCLAISTLDDKPKGQCWL